MACLHLVFAACSILYEFVCLLVLFCLFCFVSSVLPDALSRVGLFSEGLSISFCRFAFSRLCLLVVVCLLVCFMVALLYESPRRKPV